jgi:hypothetical protein
MWADSGSLAGWRHRATTQVDPGLRVPAGPQLGDRLPLTSESKIFGVACSAGVGAWF